MKMPTHTTGNPADVSYSYQWYTNVEDVSVTIGIGAHDLALVAARTLVGRRY